MKKIRNLVLILALFMCFNGCEKNPGSEEPIQNSSQFTIEQAQAWFGSEWTGAVRIKSGNIEKARIGIKPDWCNGFTSQNDEVEVVEVGLLVQGWFGMSDEASYQDWVKTKNSKMIRSLTRMVFLKYKKEDRIDQFLMTVVGDKEYHDKKVGRLADNSYLAKEKHFSGRIYYHDLTGKFVNGWVYEKGELVGIAKQTSGEGLPTELKMASTCITTTVNTTYIECTDWYADSNHNGVYDLGVDQYMTYSCKSVFSAPAPFTECPVYSTSLDGFKTDYVVKVGGTNGGYDPSQSTAPVPCNCLNKCSVCGKCKDALILKSAGTSCVPWAVCSCPPVPEPEPAPIPTPDYPIISIQEYLKCINSSSPATITIYVDQPVANSSSTVSLSGTAGHAYIGISQGGNYSTFGFYPKTGAKISAKSDYSALGDDSYRAYDVSITKSITASELQAVLSLAKNSPGIYNLDEYNCTDFAIEIGNSCGMALPDTYSNWLGGGGSCPAALGQDIRNMTLSSGMSRNTSGGTPPSNFQNCQQ